MKDFLKEMMFQNIVFPSGERKQGKVKEVKQVSRAKREFEQKLQCQPGQDPQGILKNKRFIEFIGESLEVTGDVNAGE